MRPRRPPAELGDERGALLLVAAGGERLLELIDRQHAAARRRPRSPRRSSRSGCSPGPHDAPASRSSLPGRTPSASAGSSPARSTEDLPLPDGPTTPEQRRADQPRDQLGDQPLAAEEVRRVRDVERRQPLERARAPAPPRRRPRRAPARLQLDDAAGQLGLHRAQLGATGRRSARPPPRPGAPPRAAPTGRQLVHAPRHAAAGLQQPLDRDVLPRRRAAIATAVGVAAARASSASSAPTRRAVRVAPADQHEHRHAGERARQAGERRGHVAAGAVGVVERRAASDAPPRRHARQRGRATAAGGPRAGRVAHAPRRRDATSPASSAASRVLPIPSAPHSATSRPRAARAPPPSAPAAGQLGVAPDQRRRRGGVELRAAARRRAAQLQRRVLVEDGLVQALQLAARARRRRPRRARAARRGRPPAPRPGGRCGTARASAAPASRSRVGCSADQLPQLADERDVPRRRRGRPPRAPRAPRAAAPPAARSRPARTARTPGPPAAARATAPAPSRSSAAASLGPPARQRPPPLLHAAPRSARRRARPGARAAGSPPASSPRLPGRPSALRSRETCTCTVFVAPGGRVLAPQRERQPLRAHRLVGMQQQHGEHRAWLDAAQAPRRRARRAPRAARGSGTPSRLRADAIPCGPVPGGFRSSGRLRQVVPFGEALDWWLSVQRPVRSSVVVVVEEAGQRGAALGVGGVDAAVGPALGEGLDEALCFSVGAGPVGLGEQVPSPSRRQTAACANER